MGIAASAIGTVVPPASMPAQQPPKPAAAAPTTTSKKQAKTPAKWYSGWCGPGPECRDNRVVNGKRVRYCRQFCKNGLNVGTVSACACTCHAPDSTKEQQG